MWDVLTPTTDHMALAPLNAISSYYGSLVTFLFYLHVNSLDWLVHHLSLYLFWHAALNSSPWTRNFYLLKNLQMGSIRTHQNNTNFWCLDNNLVDYIFGEVEAKVE
jgi:hypothetical protein